MFPPTSPGPAPWIDANSILVLQPKTCLVFGSSFSPTWWSVYPNVPKICPLFPSCFPSHFKPLWWTSHLNYCIHLPAGLPTSVFASIQPVPYKVNQIQKAHVMWFHLNEMSGICKAIESKSRWVIARGWRGVTANVCGFFSGLWSCSGIRSDNGCTTLWLYYKPLNCVLGKGGFYDMWLISQLFMKLDHINALNKSSQMAFPSHISGAYSLLHDLSLVTSWISSLTSALLLLIPPQP